MRIEAVADSPSAPSDLPVTIAATQTRTPVSQASVRLLNPQPVIDPGLGIVLTEYFNQAGTMTEQYPTAKAVETYRIYGLHNNPDDVAPVKT